MAEEIVDDPLPAELDEMAAPEAIEEDDIIEEPDGDTLDDEDLQAEDDEDIGDGGEA